MPQTLRSQLCSRRQVVAGAAATALAGLSAGPAFSQRLSEKLVTIIVPFSAGSGPDIIARIIADDMRTKWGQTSVIDNKPGASGNLGATAASKAAPDGQTLVLAVNTFLMNAALSKTLQYDPVKSFDPIAELARGSLALAVHGSTPFKDVKALVEAGKNKSEDIIYSSPGRGTPHHLAMELFKLTAGTELRHVPYTGTAGAVNDFVAGHIKVMFIPIHVGLSHAQSGAIRLLAVGSDKRSPLAPDVPTFGETGFGDMEVDLWYGVCAPAGTPKDVIERYNKSFNEALASPTVKDLFSKQGLTPMGGTTQQFADLIAKDQKRWVDVVQKAKLTLE